MGCASGYLRLLHTLIALAGLALVGTSIYLLATGQQFFPDTSGQYAWTAWAPLVFGLVVFGLAVCGCCCESVTKNSCFIFIFALLQLCFGIVIVAAGAALIVLSVEYLPTIAASETATQGELEEDCGFVKDVRVIHRLHRGSGWDLHAAARNFGLLSWVVCWML